MIESKNIVRSGMGRWRLLLTAIRCLFKRKTNYCLVEEAVPQLGDGGMFRGEKSAKREPVVPTKLEPLPQQIEQMENFKEARRRLVEMGYHPKDIDIPETFFGDMNCSVETLVELSLKLFRKMDEIIPPDFEGDDNTKAKDPKSHPQYEDWMDVLLEQLTEEKRYQAVEELANSGDSSQFDPDVIKDMANSPRR
jgi:hypothetical protein